MKQKRPPDGELVDTYLTEREYDACSSEAQAIKKARSRWREHSRTQGVSGQLRRLTHGTAGESVLFTDYTSTRQISPMVAAVGLAEGVEFTSRLERSLVDDSIVGVRVTLVGFTR